MSAASILTSVIQSSPYLIRMSLSLSWMYITLGSRVRKTRKAFEQQLIMQGMAKEDANRLSTCFEELKNSLVQMLKQGLVRGL
jgi:hypothetical protein